MMLVTDWYTMRRCHIGLRWTALSRRYELPQRSTAYVWMDSELHATRQF